MCSFSPRNNDLMSPGLIIVLADRTFPELQEEAQEKLSLDRFFGGGDKSGGICSAPDKVKDPR